MRASCSVFALLALACKPVDPAPESLDALLHYVWSQLDAGEDAELSDALDNLHAAIDGDTLEERIDGAVTDLSVEGAALVGVDLDPEAASGVFMARVLACDLGLLEEILASEHQEQLYEGVYSNYSREFLSDEEAFLAGTAPRVDWRNTYDTSVLGVDYGAITLGALRRVPEVDDGRAGLISRAVLEEPVVFDGGQHHLDQDYHLEMYWPRGGELLHVYALWKDQKLLGFDDEGEGTQRIMLNNLSNWDNDTEALCASDGAAARAILDR